MLIYMILFKNQISQKLEFDYKIAINEYLIISRSL